MPKHTQYGTIIDSGIEDGRGGTSGFAPMQGAVLFDSIQTLSSKMHLPTKALQTGDGDIGILAMILEGKVLGKDETLAVTYAVPWLDAGMLVGEILAALERSELSEQSKVDFAVGLQEAQKRYDQRQDRS